MQSHTVNVKSSMPIAWLDNAPLLVIFLLLVDSLHFVFARLLLPHLPPVTSVLYVMGTGTIEVAFFSIFWGGIDLSVFRRHAWFFLSIGLMVATSTNLNYAAVAFIDPGTASLLAQTSVLFGLGLGLIWLGERLARVQIIGVVVAIMGVFTIAFQPGDYLRLGSFMVLASAFIYALHAALVKRHGGQMNLTDFFFFRLALTSTFMLLFAFGSDSLVWPEGVGWLLVIAAGTVDVVISRGLYYLALRRLQLSLHSLVLTLSPAVAVLWSLLLFGTRPTLQQMVGGLAVIMGVLIVTINRNKK